MPSGNCSFPAGDYLVPRSELVGNGGSLSIRSNESKTPGVAYEPRLAPSRLVAL
jgi:hypothetical protein